MDLEMEAQLKGFGLVVYKEAWTIGLMYFSCVKRMVVAVTW